MKNREGTNMNDPVRLQRKEQKEPRIIEILNSDIVLKIKFYILFFGALALFLAFCFAIKGRTYGFL